MFREHPTPDARVARLSAEDFARAEAMTARELAAELEGLKHANDLAYNLVGRNNARVKCLGVILARKLRAADAASIEVTRGDGATMLWTLQADGTGFRRDRLARPRSVGSTLIKPDAGTG